MKPFSKISAGNAIVAGLVLLCGTPDAAIAAEARVTQVVREVKLLPANASARPAVLNDQVREGVAVRTGDRSRSELTFPDVTITRLGANTIFSFDRDGHDVALSGGSVLLRVPKNSGGGSVRTNAVSVAITGTTLILETGRGGRAKLIMLEGSGRLSLNRYRNQSRDVFAGQMLEVPAGARTLPMPKNIDLNQVMRSHPLIANFPPLPSRDLILSAARNPPRSGPGGEPIYQGQPVDEPPRGGGPVISIVPSVNLPGLIGGGMRNPGRGQRNPRNPPGRGAGVQGQNPTGQNPTRNPIRRPIAKPTATPPQIR